MKKITGSLLVCVAAAVFVAIALLLNLGPQQSSSSSTPPGAISAAAAGQPGSGTASDGGPVDAYGKAGVTTPPSQTPSTPPKGQSSAKDPGTGSNRGASSANNSATLTISQFAFSSVQVAPGATVTVTNNDSAAHTVTAKNGEFDAGTIAAKGSKTFTAPSQPGSYSFFCEIHPSMTGTLVVR